MHINSSGVNRFLAGERWLPLKILEGVGDVKGRSLALLKAGLKHEFFNEFDALEDPVYPEMVQRKDGLYSLPNLPVELPVIFSLKARKEA